MATNEHDGRGRYRYASLDLWRGVACLSVVVFHTTSVAVLRAPTTPTTTWEWITKCLLGLTTLGHVGVPMFFVISGYCIAATVESTRRNQTGTWHYFKRRLRRIFPPYWFALLFNVLVMCAVFGLVNRTSFAEARSYSYQPWNLALWTLIGNISLTESWLYHFTGNARMYILGPAWTLCYEEQFYAVMGLLLLLFRTRLYTAVLCVSALSLASMGAAKWSGVSIRGFFFDGHWLSFAVGILVYHSINYGRVKHRAVSSVLLASTILAAAAAGDPRLPVAAGFALILLAAHPWDAVVDGSRLLMPVKWCGRMCYSLYLIHFPVVFVISRVFFHKGYRSPGVTLGITLPVAMAASIGLSWLFYWFIERRFLNPPQDSHRVQSKNMTTDVKTLYANDSVGVNVAVAGNA